MLRITLLSLVLASAASAQSNVLVPDSFTLSESAQRVIDAEWLTDSERSDLRVFHGVWDDRDLDTPARRATVALAAWKFDDPALSDEATPGLLRAEALFRRGALEDAIALLGNDPSPRAARLRAEAYETLGRADEAAEAIAVVIDQLRQETFENAADLTDAVGALVVQTRLEGQPARDFQTMMDLLGRSHQELDRHYWPAILVEAQLLIDKDNEKEAVLALHQMLRLNPRCSEAWYALGRVALNRFDFSSASVAASALRRQNTDHPLAALLLAESRLIQDDPDGAFELLDPLREQLPELRAAQAYTAAAHAVAFDDDLMQAGLDACDRLSPGGADAYYVVGRHLSLLRQYEVAADILEESVRRRPAWPAPRIELGLMELQSGRDDRALDALREVAGLDPFNKRAANSLFLLEEMAGYERIETEHFVIRYRAGIDEVLVAEMPEILERLHRTVCDRFGFEPPRKTTIDLMPDHARFAVRITGMPWIHTVAACTGPVIALEVPREGRQSEHLGLFLWPRVLQHEYTHTVTLAQSRNRIPHWLTEAAAVSMEYAPRSYGNCRQLATSWREGTLFDLDEIKWAFVRPKRPGDRGRAYAQGHWMVQYMDERFGSSALIRLLDRYFDGDREAEAMPAALGVSREDFYQGFVAWAGRQVAAWGLDPQPSLETLTDRVRWAEEELAVTMDASVQARLDVISKKLTDQIGRASTSRRKPLKARDWPSLVRPPVRITQTMLDEWLAEFPDHPDLLELKLRRWLSEDDVNEEHVPLLERYAITRPVDPFPHMKLAEVLLASDDPQRAVPHLQALDAIEDKSPVFSIKLAKLHRAAGRNEDALYYASRALHFDPYDAPGRELAAAVALENGEYEIARSHIEALTRLEPDRPRHLKRLEAIERLMQK